MGHLLNNSSSSLSLSAFSLSSSLVNKSLLESDHFIVPCTLSSGSYKRHSHALVDCGATGYAFIDEEFARHHRLTLTPLDTPRALEVIDGRPISSGDITHWTTLTIAINAHIEKIPLFVTN